MIILCFFLTKSVFRTENGYLWNSGTVKNRISARAYIKCLGVLPVHLLVTGVYLSFRKYERIKSFFHAVLRRKQVTLALIVLKYNKTFK